MQARVVGALPKELLFNTNIKRTRWVYIAVGLLFVSSIFYITAFTTHGWGYVELENGNWVEFGLWQMCDDKGNCYSPGLADFYKGTRGMSIICLILQLLSFFLTIGYIAERFLEYDPCSMVFLAILDFISSILILVQVILYGINWKKSVLNFYPNPKTVRLNFAYAFAVVSGALTLIAGVFAIIELRASQNHFRKKNKTENRKNSKLGLQLETIEEENEFEGTEIERNASRRDFESDYRNIIKNEPQKIPVMLSQQMNDSLEQQSFDRQSSTLV